LGMGLVGGVVELLVGVGVLVVELVVGG